PVRASLAPPGGKGLDGRVEGHAVHHVDLVGELPEIVRLDLAIEAQPDLGPGGGCRQDRAPPVDEGAAPEVPLVVVVVDVEAADGNEDVAGPELQPVLDDQLDPRLLERDL